MNTPISDKKLGALGGVFMLVFGVISTWRWLQTDMLFFLLLAFRDCIAAAFLFRRREANTRSPFSQQIVAYISSSLPLFYQAPHHGGPQTISMISVLLIISGFTLVTLATIEIGLGFGVSPANRGEKVATGVYQYIRHPMYAGYSVAEFGLVMINPALNGLIFVLSMSLYARRAQLENVILLKRSPVIKRC